MAYIGNSTFSTGGVLLDDTRGEVAFAGRAKPIVLIVDDDALLRADLADGLREFGFEVKEAASGQEALAVFAAGGISAVVTDRSMPGELSGDQLSHLIASHDCGVPVLMMSGTWPEPCETTAILEFFPKPVDIRAIGRLLAHVVDHLDEVGPV